MTVAVSTQWYSTYGTVDYGSACTLSEAHYHNVYVFEEAAESAKLNPPGEQTHLQYNKLREKQFLSSGVTCG
jgi:hypothetical protein